jgi:NADH dehydrogenase FAD-containing subunit
VSEYFCHPLTTKFVRYRRVQERTLEIMHAKNIQVIFNCRIVGCKPSEGLAGPNGSLMGSTLCSDSELEVPFDECFWCTQAQGQSWLKETGLETTEDGFICVSSTLECTNANDVFACGDVAHLTQSPRPKAGVIAVRAG